MNMSSRSLKTKKAKKAQDIGPHVMTDGANKIIDLFQNWSTTLIDVNGLR